ncbi:MAG: hypothetical protein ABI870_13765, partial [Rhodanobacter sp.]
HQAAPIQLRATIQSVKVYQRADCTDNPERLRHLVPIHRTRHPESVAAMPSIPANPLRAHKKGRTRMPGPDITVNP